VCFLAPAVAASALLGAFWRLVEERGSLLVGRLSGHTVVAGLGNLGSTLARHLARHGRVVVGIEHREDAPGIAELRRAGSGVALVGDLTSPELLGRARVMHAYSVFFTSPSDVANLDAAFLVRRLCRTEGGDRPPTVYAHVFDAGLGLSLAGALHRHAPGEARIVPFNSYRFAAKALLAQLVRDRLLAAQRVPGAGALVLARTSWPDGDAALDEPERGGKRDAATRARSLAEDRRRLRLAFRVEAPNHARTHARPPDRLVIVGLGRFGRSVARELLDAAAEGAHFLVVERSESSFHHGAELFSDEERARLELFLGDAVSPAAITRVTGFAPTAVIVCTDNDLSNLRLAVDLHRRDVKAVTRMFDLEASAELSRGLDERGIFTVGLSRLFRAAIPILTHELRLLACVNLDVAQTPEVDHLFYLARVSADERRRLGDACVPLADLPGGDAVPPDAADLAFVWHRAVPELAEQS
jgi:Trk K+ transport system NAD-binding subunit